MRRTLFVAIMGGAMIAAANARAVAQSIAQRVARADGVVEIVFPNRPGVCGDGRGMIGNLFGRSMSFDGGSVSSSNPATWRNPACEPGPTRVEVSVAGGQVTRLRTFAGPLRSISSNIETINATSSDAAAWLSDLVLNGGGRVAADAMVPLLTAPGSDPWPLLLRVARDENRPQATRHSALMWLGNGVTEKLGLTDAAHDSEDEALRQQAVFVLAQRPKNESVPELIDLVKHGKYPDVRRTAIFWLGQTGDSRAADTYAELLNLR